jgi:exonuclease VII small subunit
MINTKIYKAVYELAEKLMKAAAKDDRATFEALYAELEAICTEHENTEKDHPEQWETLADFTEELEGALPIYQKALDKAVAKQSNDHIASIGFPWRRCTWSWATTRRPLNACSRPRPAPKRSKITS